jgi:hypothetical protein
MEREQIIEILETWDDYVLGGDINDDIADAILAIPLDVPSDEEVMEESLNGHISLSDHKWMSWFNDAEQDTFIQGAKWMRDEIIKRNK